MGKALVGEGPNRKIVKDCKIFANLHVKLNCYHYRWSRAALWQPNCFYLNYHFLLTGPLVHTTLFRTLPRHQRGQNENGLNNLTMKSLSLNNSFKEEN